jgi:hypothetical protein
LADWGGGSFGYLEHLEKLAEILDRNLQDTRQTFAASSTIELELPAGVRLLDAAGLPVALVGNTTHIRTGGLRAGSERRFTFTLEVPTTAVGEVTVHRVALIYGDGTKQHEVLLPQKSVQFAVLHPERRIEATASIDKDVYKESWISNNVGALKRRVRDSLASGDLRAAKSELAKYDQELQIAEKKAQVPMRDDKVGAELSRLAKEVDDAGSGTPAEQKSKQNRLGKALYQEGLAAQRK